MLVGQLVHGQPGEGDAAPCRVVGQLAALEVDVEPAQEAVDAILHDARVRGVRDDVTALVIRRLADSDR